jgi:hypothetical protein
MIIRAEQMDAFENGAWLRFEDDLVAHGKEFSPRLSGVLGDEQLRVAIRLAMNRARGHGFTNRGPIRLYVEMAFLCGSAFDSDPQYSEVGAILRSGGDQMKRARRIHDGSLEYLEKVSGPDNANVRKALEDLAQFARAPVTFDLNSFVPGMLREMHRLFPQRAAYAGEQGLTALVEEGRAEAQKCGFTAIRAQVLLVTLMYAFGHGCTDDPLYPWISRTLKDERIKDPASRAERLEKKAIVWLDHVLAGESSAA